MVRVLFCPDGRRPRFRSRIVDPGRDLRPRWPAGWFRAVGRQPVDDGSALARFARDNLPRPELVQSVQPHAGRRP